MHDTSMTHKMTDTFPTALGDDRYSLFFYSSLVKFQRDLSTESGKSGYTWEKMGRFSVLCVIGVFFAPTPRLQWAVRAMTDTVFYVSSMCHASVIASVICHRMCHYAKKKGSKQELTTQNKTEKIYCLPTMTAAVISNEELLPDNGVIVIIG
jgi:hypothetical protein